MPGRTKQQCQQRWRRIKPPTQRKKWSEEEDTRLLQLVQEYGKNWGEIAKLLGDRTSKQVRERFINKLDPQIRIEKWTEEEDLIIIQQYSKNGPFWSDISKHLEGRPENMVKNRFYSHIKKRFEKLNFQDAQESLFPIDGDIVYTNAFDISDQTKSRESITSRSQVYSDFTSFLENRSQQAEAGTESYPKDFLEEVFPNEKPEFKASEAIILGNNMLPQTIPTYQFGTPNIFNAELYHRQTSMMEEQEIQFQDSFSRASPQFQNFSILSMNHFPRSWSSQGRDNQIIEVFQPIEIGKRSISPNNSLPRS